MTENSRRRTPQRLLPLLLGMFTVLGVVVQAVSAQESRIPVTPAISQAVYLKLQAAQKLVEQKRYNEAHDILEALRGRKRLSNYELIQAWNYTAYVYYLQERYAEAIDAYEVLLKIDDIPLGVLTSTLSTLSQIYLMTENYEQASSTAQRLLALDRQPPIDVYLLLGQAHYQLRQYQDALAAVQKAIDLSRTKGESPGENWLLLLQAIYFELSDYKSMEKVLKQLVELYPREQHLRNLAAIYAELDDIDRQLAVWEALLEAGYANNERDILNLVNLYLLGGTPVKAGALLEQSLKKGIVESSVANLRLLSLAWQQAREYDASIPPLEAAAKTAKEGDLSVELAQIYLNQERWFDTVQAAQEGLRKGTSNSDQAHLFLGIAQFNLGEFEAAQKSLQQVGEDDNSRRMAKEWLAFIRQEHRRLRATADISR